MNLIDRWERVYSSFFARRWDARATRWRKAAFDAREDGFPGVASTAELHAVAAQQRAAMLRRKVEELT